MEIFEKWPEKAGMMGVRSLTVSHVVFCMLSHNCSNAFLSLMLNIVNWNMLILQVSHDDSHKGRSGTGACLDWHDICIGLIQREKHVCCLLTWLHNSQQPGKVSIGIRSSQEIDCFLPVEDLSLQSLSHAAWEAKETSTSSAVHLFSWLLFSAHNL